MRRNSFLFLTIMLMAVVAAISGCQISPRIIPGQPTPTPKGTPAPTSSPTPVPTATPTPIPPSAVGKLYVTNQDGNSILRFDNALSATGNVAPGAVIQGTSTTLNNPQYVAFNPVSDSLYVANVNGGSVVVYDGVSTKNGDAPPTRIITGAATGLVSPSSVALDANRDLLYVADGPGIFVFSPASTAKDNVAFAHQLTVSFDIRQIFLDAANDRLYATDLATNTVNVFDNVSTLPDGAVTASRSITGAQTQLNVPNGMAIDPSGNLVVTNQGNGSITVYPNAATVTGDQAPIATISGPATTLSSPQQIIQSSAADEVYVADSSANEVAVFAGIAGLNGSPSPTRRIFGPSTLITGTTTTARGVALDPTR